MLYNELCTLLHRNFFSQHHFSRLLHDRITARFKNDITLTSLSYITANFHIWGLNAITTRNNGILELEHFCVDNLQRVAHIAHLTGVSLRWFHLPPLMHKGEFGVSVPIPTFPSECTTSCAQELALRARANSVLINTFFHVRSVFGCQWC